VRDERMFGKVDLVEDRRASVLHALFTLLVSFFSPQPSAREYPFRPL
jgi:hypothetical protein